MFLNRSRRGGLDVLATLLALVLAIVAVGVSVSIIGSQDTDRIGEEEQQKAKDTLSLIFTSAQNSFVHKSGGVMAGSLEELGDGFTIGSFGSLIYEDIWAASIKCKAEESTERAMGNALVRKRLESPYRYGILKVKGVASEKEDDLTTCIVAVPFPFDGHKSPALVMLAGPIRNDPSDFMKAWPIVNVENISTIAMIRKWVEEGIPVDEKKKMLLFNKSKARKESS